MPKLPVKAPVTTDIRPACDTDRSGCDSAHSRQRIYIMVVTSIIKRGRTFHSSSLVAIFQTPCVSNRVVLVVGYYNNFPMFVIYNVITVFDSV